MPFAKRGDVVHSEATSGFNNQKKSLLINGLAALGDSLHPLQFLFLFLFPVLDWPAHGGCTLGCRAKHPQSLPISPNTGAARHRPDGTAAATTVF